MIEVQFTTNSTSEVVATFEEEALYIRCLPILMEVAAESRMIVTESIVEGD